MQGGAPGRAGTVNFGNLAVPDARGRSGGELIVPALLLDLRRDDVQAQELAVGGAEQAATGASR